MAPDVPLAQRSKDGIDDGVAQRVSIRVPVKTMRMGNIDSAQNEATAVNQGMDVPTFTDTEREYGGDLHGNWSLKGPTP
jgi:hypothetical protein